MPPMPLQMKTRQINFVTINSQTQSSRLRREKGSVFDIVQDKGDCVCSELLSSLSLFCLIRQTMAVFGSNRDILNRRKWKLTLQSYYLSVAALFTFSAFIGVVSLQSSINIEAELGTTSLVVCYVINAICNATMTPVLLKLLGPRRALALADVFYIAYSVANIYPSYFTILPAAVFLGVAQAITWSNFPNFNQHFGREFAKLRATETRQKSDGCREIPVDDVMIETYVGRFVGKFFSVLSGYLILGNVITYVILNLRSNKDDVKSPNITSIVNDSLSPSDELFSSCGAKQCIVGKQEASTDNDVISNKSLEVVLFLSLAFLQLISLLIHLLLLKDPTPLSRGGDLNAGITGLDKNGETMELNDVIKNNVIEVKKEGKLQDDKETGLAKFLQTLRHLADVQEMLIIPLKFQYGLSSAFIFADFTRSYVSCTMQLQSVGMLMTLLGVVEVLSGIFYSKFSSKFGRLRIYFLVVAMETANLLFSLFWPPSGYSWAPYVMAILWGASDGLKNPVFTGTVMTYFSDKEGAAYSAMALVVGLGGSFILVFFVIAERRFNKRKK
ncbi:protein unc-93 homolog A-like isoform X3 [Clavelina lepadiformis]|uniref:protein unc-93 homolog A-like isoform X3 n=1 Tax=Clavelina lepadiformis TaxID=159417 RepID=UPI0040423AC9